MPAVTDLHLAIWQEFLDRFGALADRLVLAARFPNGGTAAQRALEGLPLAMYTLREEYAPLDSLMRFFVPDPDFGDPLATARAGLLLGSLLWAESTMKRLPRLKENEEQLKEFVYHMQQSWPPGQERPGQK